MGKQKEPLDKRIKVTAATRERLKRRGNKDDSYEDVITRMLNVLEAMEKE